MSAKKRGDRQASTTAKLRVSPQQLAGVAAEMRRLLQFHRQIGIGSYPIIEGLRPSTPPPTSSPQPSTAKTPRRRASNRSETPPVSPDKTVDGKAIEELSRHVAACRQCTLSTNTLAVPSSAATGKVRLMFVGDYCCDLSPGEKPFLFGEAEDRMLVNMVSALGLSMTDVYVTNCLKCQGPKAVSGGQEELVRCLPFLFREIAAIRPSVICAMGDCSAQAVLNSTKPVVRLRGTFHRYRYYDQYPIEVMVTFHPRFLLAHQELKRATWTDLQLIQKRFLLPGG